AQPDVGQSSKLAKLSLVDIGRPDDRAFGGEHLGSRAADTLGCCGDHRRLSFKPTGHVLLLSSLVRFRKRCHKRPRAARLLISALVPNVQGSTSGQRLTALTRAPSSGAEMVTMSPTLWVKPTPGVSRSSVGANMVP